MKAAWRASFSGYQRSSASRKAISRPRAARIASLRAAAAPPFVARSISRMRGSAAASARARAREPSVEASSTRSSSQSARLCARTEATVSASVAAAFQTGVTTETSGAAAAASVRQEVLVDHLPGAARPPSRRSPQTRSSSVV